MGQTARGALKPGRLEQTEGAQPGEKKISLVNTEGVLVTV